MPLVMGLEVPDAQICGHLAEVASYLTSRLRKLDHVSKVQQQSQDSSHPDDHFKSRQVSSGLKPFSYLRSNRRQSETLANDYISYARNVRRVKITLVQPPLQRSWPCFQQGLELSKYYSSHFKIVPNFTCMYNNIWFLSQISLQIMLLLILIHAPNSPVSFPIFNSQIHNPL